MAGASYLDVGWPYGISTPKVYSLFHRTLTVLDDMLPPLQFPQSEEECHTAASNFQKLQNTPLHAIIAALDGIAISIRQPSLREVSDPRKYYNRKGYYALCVQAAVTADYRFVFLSSRHAGGTIDSTAFNACVFNDLIRSGKLPHWAVILADDSYVKMKNLITPYKGKGLTVQRDTFNFYHSS